MSNIIKLFLIALLVVILISTIVIFSVPKVKERIFNKKKVEEALKAEEEQKKQVEIKEERAKREEQILSTKQVFDLAEKLKEREIRVKEQEERVQRLEEAVNKEKEAIMNVKKEVEKMHVDIAQFIPMITDGEKKNLKKMAKMFETLSPDNANPIISRMPDDTLVIVLSYMKPRGSAKLLSGYAAINPETAKRAADIAEKLKKLVIK
ncbi:MAG: hypothetical protein ACD_79C00585G0006 [uncultured bacterium]|nr:MAG: hypothetical protein ACD_79C00585G0006 [uncultured bacterium]